MKIKLLATLASVLMAGTALAQNPFTAEGLSVRNLDGISLKSASDIVKAKTQTKAQESSLKMNTARIQSMQKVAELDGSPIKTLATGDLYTIEGKYTLYIDDCYYQDGEFDTSFPVTISYDAEFSRYLIIDDTKEWFMSQVPFTFSNNTMTIGQVNFGTALGDGYQMLFTTHIYNWSSQSTVQQSTMKVPFNPNTGVFTFAADAGFGWWQYNLQGRFTGNFYNIFDVYRGEQAPKTVTDTWEDAGTAVFMDGWVLPELGYDQKDVNNWFEVPLQQSSTNKNRYRLVDPYHKYPYFKPGENISTTTGYINFDISDANHVVVETGVEAGWANTSEGITKFYCFNTLAYYMGFYKLDANTVIAELGNDIPYTTHKNGVIDVGSYYTLEYGLEYDAMFGYQVDPLFAGMWAEEDETPIDMTARIVMPGGKALGIAHSTVEASTVSDKTATVSFDFKTFNLAASDKVYVTLTNGRLYTRTFEISGTHADVVLDGLTPNTSYTLTLTLDAKAGNSTVATSFPTTVTFKTIDEIVEPEPEINAPAYVMVGLDDTADLTSYFAEVEVAGWTSSDDEVATVAGGVVSGVDYGTTVVTAMRDNNDAWASTQVLVCPVLTVLYPEGVETSHLVGYDSPIDVQLTPANGWRVCTASVEGRDISYRIEGDGRLLSNMTVTDDTMVNIATAKTTNPSWADNIRLIVDGRLLTIVGADEKDTVYINNYTDEKNVYDGDWKEIPFSEGGVFNVRIIKAGETADFRIVIR